MAVRRSAFSVDVTEVLDIAERLARVENITQDAAVVRTLNQVVDDVYETARGRMNSGINLEDSYLQSKMAVVHATPERGLRAEIIARGGRGDQTPLSRYMVGQATTSAPRARGDAARGIPAGQKRAGVKVEVSRGSVKTLKNAFTMPLRAGGTAGGNGIGIFTRSRYGVLRHRYGPAVYQLFRVAAGELEQSVGDILVDKLGTAAEEALERAING